MRGTSAAATQDTVVLENCTFIKSFANRALVLGSGEDAFVRMARKLEEEKIADRQEGTLIFKYEQKGETKSVGIPAIFVSQAKRPLATTRGKEISNALLNALFRKGVHGGLGDLVFSYDL